MTNQERNKIKNKPSLSVIISLSSIVLFICLIIGIIVYKFTSGYFEKMSMVKKSSESSRNVEVVLPDGSKVWLNSESEIRYPKQFTPDKREVFFEGEAFFAIVKNEEKPFIINSINSRIEVVGTTFNLRAYEEEPELILNVVSGEVILFDKNSDKNAIQLKRGEQGVFHFENRVMDKLNNTDINYLSWQTGKFFFKDKPLGEITKKLITFYQKQIVFENEELKKCRITLDINNRSMEEVMEDIKKTLPLEYEIKKGKVVIIGKSCI